MNQKQTIGRILLGTGAAVLFFVIGDAVAGTPVPTCCVTHYCYDENDNLISKASDCTKQPCKVDERCVDLGDCSAGGNATAIARCVPSV